MFASIMDGMKAQRERSTTNRREAAKLFNEHLKNQSELGIEVTEQSLSDAWDANSGGVLRKHAPTQQRLQSIVAAQNKSLAEKKAADDFAATEQQRKVDAFVLEDLKRGLNENSMLGDGARSVEDLNTSFTEMFENNPLMMESYSRQAGVGGNRLGEMQKGFYSEVQAPQMQKVMELIATGSFDAETLKRVYPNVDPAFIDDAVAKAIKTEAQRDKEFNQADIIFNEGRITFNNKQVVFNSEQEAAILSAAQLVKDRSFTNTSNEMTLDAAREAVTRLVIEQAQKDIVFGREGITFRRDIQADILKAADLVITRAADNARNVVNDAQKIKNNTQTNKKDGQENTVFDQSQEMVIPERIEQAMVRGGIDASVKNGTASLESITEIMNLYNVTDDKIIKRVWEQSQTIMNQATDIEMQKYNKGNVDKRAAGILEVDKYMANLKKKTNENIGTFFPDVSDTIGSAITIIADKYQFAPNAYVGAFSDWINSKVDDGTFGKDVDQTVIIAAMSAEIENPQDPRVKLMSQTMKPSTYSSQKQSLLAQKTKAIGVDRYTTDSYKKVLVKRTQEELDTYLMGMEFAIQNGDINKFQDNQTAIADLVLEMNADMEVRESDFKTAFGPRVTLDEAQEVMGEMTKILEKALSSSGAMTAPIPPPTKVAYLFADDLFMGTGTLKNVAQGLSMVNGKIASFPKSSTTTGGGQSTEEMKAYADKAELEGAQATFDGYKSQTDDLQNQKDALNPNQAFEKKALHDQILAIAKKARNLQARISSIMEDLEP